MDKLKNWINRNLSVNSYCWPEGGSFESFARCVSNAGLSQVGLNTGILANIGAKKARRILNDYGLTVSTLNSAGYFTDSDLIHQNMAVLDMAATLDATALCIITGGVMGGAPPANLNIKYQANTPLKLAEIRAKSLSLYNEFAHEAAKCNVLLGLEPIAPFDIVTKGHVNSINAARHYLDMPQWRSDSEFSTGAARFKNRELVWRNLKPLFAKKTTAEWVTNLDKFSVPVGPIYNMDEMFNDPQVQHLGIAQKVHHPVRGDILLVGQPVDLSRTPAKINTASPDAGEHTAAILKELGYSDYDVTRLRSDNVI